MKKGLLFILFLSLIESYPVEKKDVDLDKKDFYRFVHEKEEKKASTDYILSLIDKQRKYDSLYIEMKDMIKGFEGYKAEPYYCAGGERTIGYGHVIRVEDSSLVYPINREVADSLLDRDFKEAISFVEKKTGFDKLDSPYKVFALAHFVYNVGAGNFERSTLLKKIRNGENVGSEFLRWVYIINGDIQKNSHLKERRIFEKNMYNKAS